MTDRTIAIGETNTLRHFGVMPPMNLPIKLQLCLNEVATK